MVRLVSKILAVLTLLSCVAAFAYAQTSDSEYKLGYEDVIVITVVGHDELSGEFYVPSDGFINVPRVGQVPVKGKTIPETAKVIQDGMKSFLISPDVSVKLKAARPQSVYVMGAVSRPGTFDLKPGWRITEAIGAAGGIALGVENSDCTVTVLSKSTGDKRSIRLTDVMKGDASNNLPIEAGDVITIDAVETLPVYVMGKVQRPGLYNIRKDSAGLLEAITMAGGTTDDAGLTKVTVTHLSGDAETVSIVPVTVNGKQDSPIKLKSGDLVVVPDSIAKFAVLGWVNQPGFYPLKENQKTTLSDALGIAHGTDSRRAGTGKIAIIRKGQDGKQVRMVCDMGKFLKNGDVSQNPEILAGDIVYVPETGKLDIDRVLSLFSGAASMLWTLDRF